VLEENTAHHPSLKVMEAVGKPGESLYVVSRVNWGLAQAQSTKGRETGLAGAF